MKLCARVLATVLVSAFATGGWAFGGGGLTSNSIGNSALNKQTSTISQIAGPAIEMWAVLSSVCPSQIPVAGLYTMKQASLPPFVASITNGSNCTLNIQFQAASANQLIPLSLAGKMIVIAPFCNGALGNLSSCQFGSPIIFTNVSDGGNFLNTPIPGTQVSSVSNSGLAATAYYYGDPVAAAALYISGGLTINGNTGTL